MKLMQLSVCPWLVVQSKQSLARSVARMIFRWAPNFVIIVDLHSSQWCNNNRWCSNRWCSNNQWCSNRWCSNNRWWLVAQWLLLRWLLQRQWYCSSQMWMALPSISANSQIAIDLRLINVCSSVVVGESIVDASTASNIQANRTTKICLSVRTAAKKSYAIRFGCHSYSLSSLSWHQQSSYS